MALDANLQFEIGHVLFVDIVGYSKRLIDEQKELLQDLNEVVRKTEQFGAAEAAGKLNRQPTGDGMALIFFTSPNAPVACGLEIARALRSKPELQVRMGIHSGPVSDVTDVNDKANVAGVGINMAQRVMDCGDAGHILLSKRVADDLAHLRQWRPYLHDLGECRGKHDVVLSVVNLYTDDAGNPALPQKFIAAQQTARSTKKRRNVRRVGLPVAIIVMLLIVAASFTPAILRSYRSNPKNAPLATMVEKSIAVLPFENLSDEKANAYFAEGMQDEILTRLSKIAALKVISRTSTAHYATKPGNLRTIAKELGTVHVLEGSVQKAGETVHINVQLIRATTDEHLWAQSYDRDFKNIFDLEREIAETIASQLRATLLPKEATELARIPTTNSKAYDLYLKARHIDYLYWNAQVENDQPAIEMFQQAIGLDPNFVEAYAGLGFAQLNMYRADPSTSQLDRIQANAAKVLELLPDSPLGHLLLGSVFMARNDDARAAAEFDYLEKHSPNLPEVILGLAKFKGRKGDLEGRLRNLQRLTELDPRNDVYFRWLGDTEDYLRHRAEASAAYQKGLEIAPENWGLRYNATLNLIRQNKIAEARKAVIAWPEDKVTVTVVIWKYGLLRSVELYSRNYDAALAAARKVPLIGNKIAASGSFDVGDIKRNTDIGFCLFYKGDVAASREAFLAARNGLEPHRVARSEDFDFLAAATEIAIGLRERDNALSIARKAATLAPREKNFRPWVTTQLELASVYSSFGNAKEALPILRKLLETPGTGNHLSIAELRLDPIWDPVRKDPGFQKLLADFPLIY